MFYSKISQQDMPQAQQLAAKAAHMAAQVTQGAEMRVKRDKNYTLVGTVKCAEVHRIRYTRTGRSLQAVFEVTLLCGINKVERKVYVTRIPC